MRDGENWVDTQSRGDGGRSNEPGPVTHGGMMPEKGYLEDSEPGR